MNVITWSVDGERQTAASQYFDMRHSPLTNWKLETKKLSGTSILNKWVRQPGD